MSLIKNIETKIKLAFFICIACFITAIVICSMAFFNARKIIEQEHKQIYVLDNNVPIVAKKTDIEDNRQAEYKAQIETFHDYFFSLTPDNQYIETQLNRAMYLIDVSGISQYNTLKEKGFFTSIVSTSSIITCTTDSIHLDMNTKRWMFYGKLKIERPSMVTVRSLVTTGALKDVPRTQQNSHGVLLTNWKTIENKDLESNEKKVF
jgi:conjugative transposon TraK protein